MTTPLTFSLWTEDGQRHDTVLRGPGGTIRVCVGDPAGAHSAVWRIWAGRNACDVYVAARDIAGIQKFSLHESGDWRQQFVTTEHAQQFTNQPNRIIDQWPQPAEHADSRLTLGYSIRVRRQDLADYPEEFPKDLEWLPAPPEGKAMVIHIVISRLHDEPVNFGGMVPFAGFTLVDNRAVLILAQLQDISPTVNARVDAAIKAVQETPEARDAERPRMAIHGSNEHGRFSWDVALRPTGGRASSDGRAAE